MTDTDEFDAILEEYVDNGIEWLNKEFGNDWPYWIDLKVLDMTDMVCCVLGHMPGGWAGNFPKLNLNAVFLLGFDGDNAWEYSVLDDLWYHKISELRERRTPENPNIDPWLIPGVANPENL